METLHLRTDTKQDMLDVLVTAGFIFVDDELVTATHMTPTSGYFISMSGELRVKTGNIIKDDEGNEYYETAPIYGYHANLRCNDGALTKGVSSITIDVNTPLIKIAGE